MRKPTAKVFIDASNVFYAQKKLGWLIDWKKLKDLLNTKYVIKQINFYIAVKKNDNKINFLGFLEKIDYTVITKPLKEIKDTIHDENGMRIVADKIHYFEDIKKEIYRRNWNLTKDAARGINRASN